MRKLLSLWMLVLASCVGGLDEPMVLVDSTCAEILCGWQITQGNLVPAGSWHEHQRAVQLVGTPASATKKLVGIQNTQCFAFTFLSQVESGAQLSIELDFNDDGTVDASTLVPAVTWRRFTLGLRAPTEYRSVRISLRKLGDGDVRIAQLVLTSDYVPCVDITPTRLADGAVCSTDATCGSNRCVLGKCATLPLGGVGEGEACRSADECRDGACAAGTCKACAKNGSCGSGEACSLHGQCASGTCTQGALPSKSRYPGLEGACGDCDADTDCGGGFCFLGHCSQCRSNADCSDGLVCRYTETFDATTRACLPRITSLVPRGGLCTSNDDCEPGLGGCNGVPGRDARCGVACVTSEECGRGMLCTAAGLTHHVSPPAQFALLPAWSMVSARINTCHPLRFEGTGCEAQDQCADGTACCAGGCRDAELDPDTATCIGADILPAN